MKFMGMDLSDAPGQYLRAGGFLVSLMSVWMLVGLFAYLNRYTKRDYFTAWTAAWLFYSLWLTLGLRYPNAVPGTVPFKLQQCCAAISSVFLLWGSLRFLKMSFRQTLLGLFMLFLVVWTFASQYIISDSLNAGARRLETELPVFILLGLSSVFAGVCFFRLRKKMPFVGAGMLAIGFFLWGLYLGAYPLSEQDANIYSAGFFLAAVLQLFIAVSMIVLVLEEIRYASEKVLAEVATVRSEKEALQLKIITTEEQCRSLYDKARVTEGLQEAYDELRQTQETVVQQERLRALGQMASGVAHDINNSLTPVVAYTEILLDSEPHLPETVRHYLEIIKQSGEDVAQIVARMREFYRRRTGSEALTEVDINQTIREVIELTRPRWRDISQREGISIQFHQELAETLPRLVGNPSELREALINLVFNAVDALPRGGVITFVTRVSAGRKDGAREQQLQIEVKDNGIGMDAKTRQHCLEPFFSTKALRGGSGLGLAMVYGMMQRHDGVIDIESAPSQGTCIRLTFPLRPKPAPDGRDSGLAVPTVRSLRVLCIDDDPLIRQLLNDCLVRFHHQVTTASGGDEAVKLFQSARQNGRPFDIVVTDLGMPRMDGHQLARAIKAESPGTPVIMMTGWGAMMKADGESAPEVDALIGKPPQLQELNNLLLRLVPLAPATDPAPPFSSIGAAAAQTP
jgi:signal transduction histidine kinase/ActR/RegA family two-component response regulator